MSGADGLVPGNIPDHEGPLGLHDLGTLQRTLAPVTTADLFKSDCYSKRPKSGLDISRFLSREGRVRQPSSLKASASGFGKGMISLGTGRPSPETYPFESMEFVYSSPTSISRLGLATNRNGSRETRSATSVSKRDPSASIDLAIALSYGYSLGSEQLIQYLTTHVSCLHSPPYSDWEICLTGGNTMALETTFRNFADPGDFVLVEEYTYSGTIEAAGPLGLTLVPVAMDSDGINPKSLDDILSTWEQLHPGTRRPKLLYIIPTGHNPTGITQPRRRRQDVLEVAERHDILIVEDDPYHYLQFPQPGGVSDYLSIPSYLSLSRTGRVIRLDSTSKILAPGLRLGWLTAPKAIVETFQAAHDLGFVQSSGVSQLVMYKLVSERWGHGGFLRWLNGLAGYYHAKATVMLQAMERELGTGILEDVCSWNEISAGMFIWLKIDCTRLPEVSQTATDAEARQRALLEIEDRIHTEAINEGVLPCKGSYFRASTPPCGGTPSNGAQSSASVFLRLTFASSEKEEIVTAVGRLGTALRKIFNAESGVIQT
ncbi:Aromatic amino acid aminotransferase [Cladophialophora carrionii]|uniref:Aromatic amino acid aminotransferase n=1 Tax=Cladophialophora carrionii TaxID=86049 RepID=A0A1C1C9H4_9EURO|nr:Aromatic amino acid aminotransferase [Cladophialophora carrionii]